ncbi:hypothetical protein GCM10007380_16240 [Gottfriedia solisilvae]|uniref:Uncharacterized protein n=1 Tax=Gottfriedia solisilvae TaxID=1516104 RepID=A0A8J3AGU9_9BACI|nr:hypothetical protein GCM10007380_16240 [Gottfriedia solisilvae]
MSRIICKRIKVIIGITIIAIFENIKRLRIDNLQPTFMFKYFTSKCLITIVNFNHKKLNGPYINLK